MKQFVSIISILFLVGCSQNQESEYTHGKTTANTTVTVSGKHGSASASVRAEAPDGFHVDFTVEARSKKGYTSSKTSVRSN